jgi:hypothetical protein
MPAALLASGLVVAAAVTVLVATGPSAPSTAQSCSAGREWVTVTVQPLVVPAGAWRSAQPPPAGASLAGCVDTSQLPDTTQTTDARG